MEERALAILQAGIQLVSATLYLWVARVVLDRDLQGEAKRANALFGVWWLGLALVFLISPVFSLSTRVFGFRDLAFAVTLLNIILVLIIAAVWGLVYYLVYLYTGNPRTFWPVAAFYGALAFGFLYLIAWLEPNGFNESGRLTYARDQLSGAPAIAVGLSFSLPVVLAALAYGSLYFRVSTPEARYRIALISGAFLLQFGWSATSSALQLSRRYPNSFTLSLVGSTIAIAAAIAILFAFRPPRAWRERLAASREVR